MKTDKLLTKQASEAILAGIPKNQLFTPVIKSTGKRVVMRVIAANKTGVVHDEITGKDYRVEPKDCGLDCFCDAWAEEIQP